jgi:tRNA nucleotidyltransferase (CCA-adding enzyme)
MKTFLVGGAIRDALLGQPGGDRDWVVVGATPERMGELGYLPVGRDFPVFLHPETREEYALARTERKSAPGYRGFVVHAAPDVTLEQDLARRDLTVNAMALPEESVAPLVADAASSARLDPALLVDPYGGQRDLRERVLRHVTDAFREDPVRILRVARFAARFDDFEIAPQTMALMREMVEAGEADALVPERVWQELARGLMEKRPSRMFEVLRECGALAVLLPEVDRLWGVPQTAAHHPEVDTGVHVMLVLDMAARLAAPLGVRFACLTHDLGKGTTPADVLPRHIGHEQRSARLLRAVCERWRVPVELRELADMVAREHGNIHRSGELGAAALLRLLERCDALRKPQRFAQALLACECDARGRLGLDERPYPQRQRLLDVLAAAAAVDTRPVAEAAALLGARGPKIGEAIARARVAAVGALLAASADFASMPPLLRSPAMQKPPRLTPDAALFLDFDGTLVDLAETPEAIEVPPALVALLTDLHELLGGALAIVSGRQIDAIDRFLAPLRLPAAGEHGVQRRDADGQMREQRAPDLAFVLEAANRLANEHTGLLIERKHAAIALHYRQAPELEAVCRAAMTAVVDGQPQLELLHGKFVFEVKPSGVNKGVAIDAFMKEAPFAGRVPVFAGDDTTDETGFAVVQPRGGIAIKVGSGPTQALHRLDSTRSVFEWLLEARDLLQHPPAIGPASPGGRGDGE